MSLHQAVETTAQTIFEIGFVLLLAAVLGWVARRFGLPAVIGYLVTGLIVSPFTPGYIASRNQLELLADVGVILLLFEVGIELDPLRLGRNQTGLLAAVPIQTIGTAVLGWAVGMALGLPLAGAVLLGLSVAMSSSVVVVNITRSRRRTTNPGTDEVLLGWSVLQDLIGVTISLVAVITLGLQGRSGWDAFQLILLYALLVVVATWLLPAFLRRLRTEHDLFLIVSVASALALAGVGSVFFGVPLALAAFLSGLAISESPESQEARERILPFRDVFAVMFFVAIGTLIDPTAVVRGWYWLLAVLGLLLVAKTLPVYLLARITRLRANPAQVAIGLGQVGEFSFVLATIGLSQHVVPKELYSAILAAVVLTIAISTVLVRLPRRARRAIEPRS